jgi:type I restriction enzyme, R subunit
MSKQTDTTEKGLEAHIAKYLVNENGYLLRENTAYDNVACLDSDLLFEFFEDSAS